MAVGVMKGLINRGSRTRRTFVNKCLSHARYPMFYTAHFHTGIYWPSLGLHVTHRVS